ncbi:MAG: D-3-phosphoglycerate dehydrogenase [Verrucomicrobiota bacterium]|jgi:phosphoglycerate dehydrogenase-like enzyme
MPPIRSLLVALTPQERERFLPGQLAAELPALATELHFLDPAELGRDGFFARLAQLDPEVLLGGWQLQSLPAALPPSLRYLCYLTGSVRRLVTRAQIEQGFLVTNWGGTISRTVAECALYHVLACLRRGPHWTFTLHHEGGWRDGFDEVRSLFGRSVGLHGYGSVAREFLKLIRPFDCRVEVFAPDFDAAAAARTGANCAVSLESLFAGNDIIVEFAPLNPATTGVVTEKLLRLIRPGGVFVNTARAAITDETALLRVATEGRIAVGLDVFVQEPLPPDSPWRGLRNASLTPHIAGPTVDRYPDAGAFALKNLRAYAEGRPLEAVVTPAIYDQST